MAYADMLYRCGLRLYAFKEYMKVVVGIYGEPGQAQAAEARTRAGIVLREIGGKSSTNAHAAALRKLYFTGPTPRRSPAPAAMRLRLGEELLAADVTDDGEALQEFLKVLTVEPVPEKMRWMQTAAHLRAAQALLLAGDRVRARAHLEAAADGVDGEYRRTARRLLADLAREEAKP